MEPSRVCRSCLRQGGEMKQLFLDKGEHLENNEPPLDAMFMSSTQVQINTHDGFPGQICLSCNERLLNAFTFKKMCRESDMALKKHGLKKVCNMIAKSDATDSQVIKQEKSNGNNSEIIDFNTVLNSDISSVKVEDNESTFIMYDDVKSATRNKSAICSENEKCTQTTETNFLEFHNCPECQKKFNTILGLNTHLKKHLSCASLTCTECNKVFSSNEQHRNHDCTVYADVSIEEPVNPYLCTICNRQFTERDAYERHQRSHNKRKNFSCYKCQAVFNNVVAYENHNCGTKNYKVKSGGKFSSPTKLNQHCNESHKEDSTGQDPQSSHTTKLDNNMQTSIIKSEEIFIKEEPLDDILEQAERTNQIMMEEESDNYMDMDLGFKAGSLKRKMSRESETVPQDINWQCTTSTEPPLLNEEINQSIPQPPPNFSQVTTHSGSAMEYVSDEDFDPTKSKKKRTHKKTKQKRKVVKKGTNFDCVVCKKVFSTKAELKGHRTNEHQLIHFCNVCEETFENKESLEKHELSHELVSKEYECQTCNKVFYRQDLINRHMWQHMDRKPFQCDICDKGFIKQQHLDRHKLALHSGKEKNPKTAFCEICCRGFTTSKYLETHMRMHTGDKTFTCEVCDKSFNSKWHLKEHNRWHSAEKPFLCSECGQRFIRNDYLVIHMRRHKGEKPYKCKFCDKGFPRATDLTVHERYHTGEKTHLCTVCGKGFQRQYNLTVHLRVHTGERPYVCSYCGKKFAQGNDLKSHVRRHTGERFNCDICGEGFIQGYHLTQHKRTAHGVESASHIRRVEKHPQAPDNAVLQLALVSQNTKSNTEDPETVTIKEDEVQVTIEDAKEPIVPLVPLVILPSVQSAT